MADTSIETPKDEDKKCVKIVPETQHLSFDKLERNGNFWGDFSDKIEDEDLKGNMIPIFIESVLIIPKQIQHMKIC